MDDKHVLEIENETQVSADMIEAKTYTVKQLRQVLFAGSQILPKRVAVMLLERKRYAEKFNDLRRVLEDEQQDARTRHAAATALGRLGTPESLEALREKLDTQDELVQRGVRQALDRRASALPPGEKELGLAPEEGPSWYQRLAVYREGAPGMEMTFPGANQILPIDDKQAQTIAPEPAPTKGMSTLLKQVGQHTAGLSLSREHAVSLRCAGRDLMVLLSRDKAGLKKPSDLTQRKTLLGVVAMRFGLESQAWSPKYYVLTQPGEKGDEVQVLLTSTRGRLAYAGTAQIKGERAEFSLRAVLGPGVTPAEIIGTYEAGVLRLERVLVSKTSLNSDQPSRLTRRG